MKLYNVKISYFEKREANVPVVASFLNREQIIELARQDIDFREVQNSGFKTQIVINELKTAEDLKAFDYCGDELAYGSDLSYTVTDYVQYSKRIAEIDEEIAALQKEKQSLLG
jgi:hypothetical protein